MYEISVESCLPESIHGLIESVKNGEEVVFTEANMPVAKLIGVANGKRAPQFGSAKGLFVLADDFDAPLADFDDYRQ